MCSVDGCEKPARSKSGFGLCDAHYMRMYRRGVLEKKEASVFEHSGGYIMIPAKGHPMAIGKGHAYEHRVVYYDRHGPGPFRCHWCQVPVTWDGMHIDHLDDNKKNNSIKNLVASCPECNQQRGKHKAAETWAKKTGIVALGQKKTLSQWSRDTGISRNALMARMNSGWSPDKAMSEPKGNRGPK